MTKDYLAIQGLSAPMASVSLVDKRILASGILANKSFTDALDFSKLIPTFDLGTSAAVSGLAKSIGIGLTIPAWQKEMSALKPVGISIASLMPQLSSINAVLAHDFTADLKLAGAFDFTSAVMSASAGITESILGTIKTASIFDILDQAEAFRAEIDDYELEELTDEFFQQQPKLATAISELPILITLSRNQRLGIIWFVRAAVTLYVAGYLLNLSVENPSLLTIFNVLGIGAGATAGSWAGQVTEKVLDVIPTDESLGPVSDSDVII
ncbi:hypothetical protein [Arthrobacter sp. GMC3]|uniref:hypothetical protein n=1 Tax=Arthrobacter sp. GMC3 TaxID=2058894 RepID=UPI0011B07870|nr:hypothetical protein [Arthrobacter sp. GMC3]